MNDSQLAVCPGPVSVMDQEPGSPVAGRAEEHSGSLLLTYFQGDINSMVDAHFSRALRNISKPKAEIIKGEPSSRGWDVQSAPYGSTYPPGQPQLSGHPASQISPRLPANAPTEISTAWPDGARQGACLVVPPMAYGTAPSVEGLVGTGHPYTNSLLNLLHSDRPNLNSVMVASHKQEFVPGWTRQMELRDQMTRDHSCEPGVPMVEKKNLYWY
ncbi:transcription cofactor vestigial-like protein 1 isoform X2 [Brachyhypopomus gauderio]|uniref:transcription cofactor vestigial-like protein 1 isoform X2 n=1 Tax=Brachyhypopomus gauderio TaxID=698409 RepID=UPI0040415B5F